MYAARALTTAHPSVRSAACIGQRGRSRPSKQGVLQGKVPALLDTLKRAFPREWLFTPAWKEAAAPGVWPSLQDLRSLGVRVLVVSRKDYGRAAWPMLFNRFAPWR
jgi:hypothetical protein